jgi:hypothetical protein
LRSRKKNLASKKNCCHFLPVIVDKSRRHPSELPDFFGIIYQNGKNIPNDHEMYQMIVRCTKCLSNIPNGHDIHQHFLFPRPSKIYPSWDFWSENLATLIRPSSGKNQFRCFQKVGLNVEKSQRRKKVSRARCYDF